MADYTGNGPSELGRNVSEQTYTEVKWNGKDTLNLTNTDHRKPSFTVYFTLDSNKQLTVRYHGTTGSQDYFGFAVGFEAWDDDHENDVIMERTDGIWNWGYGNPGTDVVFTADLSRLELPIYLRAICQGCCAHTGTPHMSGFAYDNDGVEQPGLGAYKIVRAHTHIETPYAPVIVSSSGTTITVRCNPDDASSSHKGQVKDTNINTWYNGDSGYLFTGYYPSTRENIVQRSSATFISRRYCSDDCYNDYKYFESESVQGSTWSIYGSCSDNTKTNELSFSVSHMSGLGYPSLAADTKIICALYNNISDRDNNTNAISTKIVDTNSTVTFTGLKPNTTYYCRAWSEGIVDENGVIDNYVNMHGKTNNMFSVNLCTGRISATTIMINSEWEAYGSASVTCIVNCNNESKAITMSGGKVGFTNLEKGTTYHITCTFKDSFGNTAIKEFDLITKKATITPTNRSSKAIVFKTISNYSADNIQISLDSLAWSNIDQNTNKIYNNLIHNTTYTLKARIVNCFAYNVAGNITSVNDSEETYDWSTLELSVYIRILEEHQHNLICIAQAYVSNMPRNSDIVDGTDFEFVDLKTMAVGTSGYQNNSITKIIDGIMTKTYVDGITIGDYQLDKKIYSNNLSYYYCQYDVIVGITDGFNTVYNTITCHTTFPYSKIYKDGKWHKAMPYIFDGNNWVAAPLLVYNNEWQECNGEA